MRKDGWKGREKRRGVMEVREGRVDGGFRRVWIEGSLSASGNGRPRRHGRSIGYFCRRQLCKAAERLAMSVHAYGKGLAVF
eukprot:936474-Pleurochrysis_carterae.AAC.2